MLKIIGFCGKIRVEKMEKGKRKYEKKKKGSHYTFINNGFIAGMQPETRGARYCKTDRRK